MMTTPPKPVLPSAESGLMKTHELKTDPDVFDLVAAGVKSFEIRKDDRGFQVNDTLLLRRTTFSGREMAAGEPLIYTEDAPIRVRVRNIMRGPVYGLAEGWVIMSIALAQPAAEAEPVNSTHGHCPHKKQPGGCQLHNLHCGYPVCDVRDTRPIAQAQNAHPPAKEVAPPQHCLIPDLAKVTAGMSWGGMNVYGDPASIEAVKRYMHDSLEVVPALRERLAHPPAPPLPRETLRAAGDMSILIDPATVRMALQSIPETAFYREVRQALYAALASLPEPAGREPT